LNLRRITRAPQKTYGSRGSPSDPISRTMFPSKARSERPARTEDMDQLALEIGRAIRRARLDRGMTLRELADSSAGRFRPTSLAGYERGERTISVLRFCELCRLLQIQPGRVLGEIIRTIHGPGEPEIDLTKLEVLRAPENELIAGFIKQVLVQRGERHVETIALRVGDVEVLASVAGRTPAELRDIVRSAQRSGFESDPSSAEIE
jgi:transcriptional regulator with XRE-family HTH domain